MITTWIVYIYLNVYNFNSTSETHQVSLYTWMLFLGFLFCASGLFISLRDSQLGSDFVPTPPPHTHTRHLVASTSRDIFGSHKTGKRGAYGYVLGTGQGCCWKSYNSQNSNPQPLPFPPPLPPKNHPVQKVNSVAVENPQSIPIVSKLLLLQCFFTSQVFFLHHQKYLSCSFQNLHCMSKPNTNRFPFRYLD